MEEIRELIRKVWPEWRITEEIGEGGFATVYKAVREDLAGTTTAAIKVTKIPRDRNEAEELRAEGLEENETYAYYRDVVRDFAAEIKLMDSVKGYTNIVGIDDYKVYQPEGEMVWYIFIRMELLTPLARYVALRGMDEERIIRLGIDLCTALEMCRQYRIVHRDIKPENIFVNDAGHFKLGDFGVARNLEKITSCFSRTGTPNYMAPEVYRSMLKETDFASASKVDIYSLGVVLYWLANGSKLPFVPEDKQIASPDDRRNAFLRRMNGEKLTPPRNVSPRLQEIILKACAYDPDDRYETAAKMRADLLALLDGDTRGGIAPVREGAENRAPAAPGKDAGAEKKADRENRRLKILSVALVLLLAAFALWTVLRDMNRSEPQELAFTTDQGVEVFRTLEPGVLYPTLRPTDIPDAADWQEWGVVTDVPVTAEVTPMPDVEAGYPTPMPEMAELVTVEVTPMPDVEAGMPTMIPEPAETAEPEETSEPEETAEPEETEAAEGIRFPEEYRTPGSIVTFGHWEQDNDPGNGAEEIEWIVLTYSAYNQKALLVSRYGLDMRAFDAGEALYGDRIWKNCELRRWLNLDFVTAAFTHEEIGKILLTDVKNDELHGYSGWTYRPCGDTEDRVFLLSYREAHMYLGVTDGTGERNPGACVAPTEYAVSKGAVRSRSYLTSDGSGAACWLLRSPGRSVDTVAMVNLAGRLNSTSAVDAAVVRPAVWVDLE